MLNKFALTGVPNVINNFSYGMLFSILFHGSILVAAIFTLPFIAKQPLDLPPLVSVELIQISEKTNIPFAPKAKKILEKVQKDNKKLLSEQAPPKKAKQDENEKVFIDENDVYKYTMEPLLKKY